MKNLHAVEEELPVEWLLRYLQNIENMKNLLIFVDASVNAWSSDFQTTETYFKNALKLIHKKFPRKSTELKIVEQDQNYEVLNRKSFCITKLKDNAPEIEIRLKNVHGGLPAEEVLYDEDFDIIELISYEDISSEVSEVVENSTDEEMETTDENSDTKSLNDSNENDENSDAEEIGSSNENSDTENSG